MALLLKFFLSVLLIGIILMMDPPSLVRQLGNDPFGALGGLFMAFLVYLAKAAIVFSGLRGWKVDESRKKAEGEAEDSDIGPFRRWSAKVGWVLCIAAMPFAVLLFVFEIYHWFIMMMVLVSPIGMVLVLIGSPGRRGGGGAGGEGGDGGGGE
ncbi:hypothetical protein [Nocardiopsis alba]|uniref:hypothetical protein n=1 Tax=Nocardiopsis alba TaxID=53437 RepID=UPI0035DE72BA